MTKYNCQKVVQLLTVALMLTLPIQALLGMYKTQEWYKKIDPKVIAFIDYDAPWNQFLKYADPTDDEDKIKLSIIVQILEKALATFNSQNLLQQINSTRLTETGEIEHFNVFGEDSSEVTLKEA